MDFIVLFSLKLIVLYCAGPGVFLSDCQTIFA